MGLFDRLLGKAETVPVQTEEGVLYLPITGRVIPLEEIPDEVFSEGILGKGCGIEPADETVCAPANGVITTVAETGHAVGILTDNGAEALIHVGMDTVDMNGDGFEPLVKVGQKVKCGQPLLKFNAAKIKAAGHPTTTAFVVTNSDDFSNVTVLTKGSASKLTAVIKIG